MLKVELLFDQYLYANKSLNSIRLFFIRTINSKKINKLQFDFESIQNKQSKKLRCDGENPVKSRFSLVILGPIL